MGCRQSEADTFCSVRIFTCLENKHLWSFLLSKIQRVKWVAGFSWGSLYFYYFRSIRMANSRSLELYCKHPAINIFKYIKMCSHTSCTNYFVPLWGKMKNTAAISPGAACTYTLRPQSCPSASTIVAGKNKCEKKKTFCGEKKICSQWCFIILLGKQHLQRQTREVVAVQWAEGRNVKRQRLLVTEFDHINLCQAIMQIITLQTYW